MQSVILYDTDYSYHETVSGSQNKLLPVSSILVIFRHLIEDQLIYCIENYKAASTYHFHRYYITG